MRERARYGEKEVLEIPFLKNSALLLTKSKALLLKKKNHSPLPPPTHSDCDLVILKCTNEIPSHCLLVYPMLTPQ